MKNLSKEQSQFKGMFSRMSREKLELTACELFEKLLMRQRQLLACLKEKERLSK